MPSIEISKTDLQNLIGKKLPNDLEELNDLMSYAKGEVEGLDGDTLKLNLEDSNRPDLWSAEGLARHFRTFLGVAQISYKVESSDYKVFVTDNMKNVRPFIACAVVKGVKLNSNIIKQLMQQQEKIDVTYGRNRAKTSIGLYKLDKLKWPLKYTLSNPTENAFVPLGFNDEMTPKDILREHPKGLQYGAILKGHDKYPIFIDAENKILSMPPIINSNTLGQIDESTTNVLIEVTGTNHKTVNNVLKILALSLADRNGKIYSVAIDYTYRSLERTPNFEPTEVRIKIADANKLLGVKLSANEISDLLKKMGYETRICSETEIEIKIPSYRLDIMHPVDIIEDIAIARGYNRFERQVLGLPVSGSLSDDEILTDKIRELCIGLGGQEIMNFNLTAKESLFQKSNMPEEDIIEIENPIVQTHSVLRNNIISSTLEFLSKNTMQEFPQKVFEVGDVTHLKTGAETGVKNTKRICFAITHSNANYTEIKQHLENLFANLGWDLKITEKEHPGFIIGRCAAIETPEGIIGLLGEVHPQVLNNWNIEQPVVLFEFKL
ncbi:MAG: phenylalanine--tRNA ligase subunit beta [Nanoarchaeota archaeon]